MCPTRTLEPFGPADETDRSLKAAERQLRLLEELSEIGMGLARGLGLYAANPHPCLAQASGTSADDVSARMAGSAFAGADVALSFSRIARAIRQIVALEQETLGMREAREGEVRTKRRQARRQSVRLAVKEAAETRHPDLDREELDGLLRDLFLDYDDYDDEFEGSEAGIIARLCKALEAQLDWAEDEPDVEAHEDRSQALDADHDDENDFAEMLGRIGSDRPGSRPPLRANGHDPP